MNDDVLKNEEMENAVDDVVFEGTEEGEGESYSKDKIKKMREELKGAKEKSQEYLTALQRERADFVNYKKECCLKLLEIVQFGKDNYN